MLAGAFGFTFWVALGLIATALLAALRLPRDQSQAALTAFGIGALRGGDHKAVARFVGSLRVVGPYPLAPSSTLVLVFGVWMVLDNAAWSFGQVWLWLALALLAAAVLAVATWDMVSKPGAG